MVCSSRAARVILLLLAVVGSGCGTVGTVFFSERLAPETPCVPRVWSGVALDLAILRGDHVEKGIVVWDLPFSLVADTLLLPYTIIAQIRFGNLCPPARESAPSE